MNPPRKTRRNPWLRRLLISICIAAPGSAEGLLIFHTWDGREVWSVTAPMDGVCGWTYRLEFRQPPFCSPSGRAIAAVDRNMSTTRLYSWLDGRLLGTVELPAPDGKHVVMAAYSLARKRPETLIFALP